MYQQMRAAQREAQNWKTKVKALEQQVVNEMNLRLQAESALEEHQRFSHEHGGALQEAAQLKQAKESAEARVAQAEAEKQREAEP